jgi:hypothetical protein
LALFANRVDFWWGGRGALESAIAKLDKYHLLILDDLAYVTKDQAKTSVLFELISARYERRSILITANQPFGKWNKVFPDPAMTLAAVDRLVHHATIFEMNVEIYRRRAAIQRQAKGGRTPATVIVGAHYHAPATPFQRLLDEPRTSERTRQQLRDIAAGLDPVRLLRDIRTAQQKLVALADAVASAAPAEEASPPLDAFLSSLKTLWQAGEARPTATAKPPQKRWRRRPDPLAEVTDQLKAWFIEEPWRTGRELLEKLQAEEPGNYPESLLGQSSVGSKVGAPNRLKRSCSAAYLRHPMRKRLPHRSWSTMLDGLLLRLAYGSAARQPVKQAIAMPGNVQ